MEVIRRCSWLVLHVNKDADYLRQEGALGSEEAEYQEGLPAIKTTEEEPEKSC